MADDKRPILIKKVKKGGHAAHGGSWKVAYADFVTAMMAFFLLMWLLSMIDPVKKQALASYFNEYSLFTQGGRPFYQSTQTGRHERGAPVKLFQKTPSGPSSPQSNAGGGNAPGNIDAESSGQIAGDLKWFYEQRAPDFIDQLQIDQFAGGVRINIMDADGKPLFESGSDTPTKVGKELLEATGDFLQQVNRRIAIGGHTDNKAYASMVYTNWELSAARASSARRIMQGVGFDVGQLVRVSGYADSDPFVPDQPSNPRNRRITITIFDGSAGGSGWEVPEPFGINDYIREHPYPPGEGGPPPAGGAAPAEGSAPAEGGAPGPGTVPAEGAAAPAGGEPAPGAEGAAPAGEGPP